MSHHIQFNSIGFGLFSSLFASISVSRIFGEDNMNKRDFVIMLPDAHKAENDRSSTSKTE